MLGDIIQAVAGTIGAADRALFGAINAYVGLHPAFDRILAGLVDWRLLRSAWMSWALVWLWFKASKPATNLSPVTHLHIVYGLAGACIATLLSFVTQKLFFVHPRPFVVAEQFGWTIPGGMPTNWGNRSSFPSDTSTLFFALSTVLYNCSRPIGILAYIWSVLLVAIPRVYLTYHFPSDVVCGALLGIASVELCQRLSNRFELGKKLLALENSKPELFYPCAFLVTHQTAEAFSGVEYFLAGLGQAAKLFTR